MGCCLLACQLRTSWHKHGMRGLGTAGASVPHASVPVSWSCLSYRPSLGPTTPEAYRRTQHASMTMARTNDIPIPSTIIIIGSQHASGMMTAPVSEHGSSTAGARGFVISTIMKRSTGAGVMHTHAPGVMEPPRSDESTRCARQETRRHGRRTPAGPAGELRVQLPAYSRAAAAGAASAASITAASDPARGDQHCSDAVQLVSGPVALSVFVLLIFFRSVGHIAEAQRARRARLAPKGHKEQCICGRVRRLVFGQRASSSESTHPGNLCPCAVPPPRLRGSQCVHGSMGGRPPWAMGPSARAPARPRRPPTCGQVLGASARARLRVRFAPSHESRVVCENPTERGQSARAGAMSGTQRRRHAKQAKQASQPAQAKAAKAKEGVVAVGFADRFSVEQVCELHERERQSPRQDRTNVNQLVS